MITYCYNIANNAMTEFNEYAFSRIWRLGDTYYGITEDGIYALSGTTDAGTEISAYAMLSPMDFKSDRQKRLPALTIDGTGSGTLSLTADSDTGSSDTEFEVNRRVKLGRGIHGRYLILDIASTEADFEVSRLTLYPEPLQRGSK